MSDRKFFNEEAETLPKDKLKALQLERLQAIVGRAWRPAVLVSITALWRWM